MDCPPVLFLIFNRPELTQRVFARIREARPARLFVAPDGPRFNKPEDIEKCRIVRSLIHVDWDCEVLKNYADTNMGCKRRVSSGLDWVFENVPEAIILEDDSLPHPTFFRFCAELLEHYRVFYGVSGSMIQAMTYGKPVLVSNLGYMGRRVRTDHIGLTFRHHQWDDLRIQYRKMAVQYQQYIPAAISFSRQFGYPQIDQC